MRDRGRGQILLVILAAAMTVSTSGCDLLYPKPPYPSPPATPLRPNVTGIVEAVDRAPDGWLLTMTDGTKVDVPQSKADEPHATGSGPLPGYLHIASTTTPKFTGDLEPLGSQPGCWDPWPAQTDFPIAWDRGDSIMFQYGIDLLKAPDYQSDVPTQDVDGRKAWPVTGQGAVTRMFAACVNSSGQVEWLKLAGELGK